MASSTITTEDRVQRFYEVELIGVRIEARTEMAKALAENVALPETVKRQITLMYDMDEAAKTDREHVEDEALKRLHRLIQRETGLKITEDDWNCNFVRERLVTVDVHREGDRIIKVERSRR